MHMCKYYNLPVNFTFPSLKNTKLLSFKPTKLAENLKFQNVHQSNSFMSSQFWNVGADFCFDLSRFWFHLLTWINV